MTNRSVETTRLGAARKLHPYAIRTSTFVRSLLAYLLAERWTYPFIIDLKCDDDGMLLAQESDSTAHLRVLCRRHDLIQAVLYLAHLVELTPAERTYLLWRVPSETEGK